jgi:hypothetical protein
MNSGTLVGSLIFAGVLVVVIAVVIQLMMRSWQRRAQRQAELIDLPDVPDEVGTALITTRGHYCGCTVSPAWNERIAVGDLGYRSKGVLTRYPEGILLQRIRATPIWIPQESITGIRMERGMGGKVVARIGILVIRWRLRSGVELDIGFRANDRHEYDPWLEDGE